jgi:hypothetical protein
VKDRCSRVPTRHDMHAKATGHGAGESGHRGAKGGAGTCAAETRSGRAASCRERRTTGCAPTTRRTHRAAGCLVVIRKRRVSTFCEKGSVPFSKSGCRRGRGTLRRPSRAP